MSKDPKGQCTENGGCLDPPLGNGGYSYLSGHRGADNIALYILQITYWHEALGQSFIINHDHRLNAASVEIASSEQ